MRRLPYSFAAQGGLCFFVTRRDSEGKISTRAHALARIVFCYRFNMVAEQPVKAAASERTIVEGATSMEAKKIMMDIFGQMDKDTIVSTLTEILQEAKGKKASEESGEEEEEKDEPPGLEKEDDDNPDDVEDYMNAHSPERPEKVKPPKAKRMEPDSWVDTDQEVPAEEDLPPPYPRSGNMYGKAVGTSDIP